MTADPELALPVRHEAIARRVAELVAADLAPGMISGILRPGVLDDVWRWLGGYSTPSQEWFLPMPLGPNFLELRPLLHATHRTLSLEVRANGAPLWSGRLRE